MTFEAELEKAKTASHYSTLIRCMAGATAFDVARACDGDGPRTRENMLPAVILSSTGSFVKKAKDGGSLTRA
ncbi:hypothetical protein VTL71DRAFT_8420 [Oculimacula yallundae]|uniref:Uncharacterized protein n=1 Tax=Oculimacula yallundae TaxID=86028 RepID=A0ABR4CYK0_9HELO